MNKTAHNHTYTAATPPHSQARYPNPIKENDSYHKAREPQRFRSYC